MTTFEPYDAAISIERSLRQLLDHAYRRAFGPDWYDELSNTKIRDNARKSRAAFEAVADDEARVAGATSELDFTRLEDLVIMARKEWTPLEEALGDERDIDPLLRRVIEYRNDVMHGRGLPASARDILSGVAVELQNRIGRYMSEQHPTGTFYPRVAAASDSRGRVATAEKLSSWASRRVVYVDVDVLVGLGERVEIEATFVDPHDRELEVIAMPDLSSGFQQHLDRGETIAHHESIPSGGTVRVAYTFTEVRHQYVTISARVRGVEHHQHGRDGADVHVSFPFEVLPPAPEGVNDSDE
ncbi:hypothetical protein [Cellulosimicrobium marinum]|uniref:hypothetical protein n=1 Tax=Cellulosimicrobium marinum TaxID=1638992 RepID=UPI001E32EAC1|nr:hypothetical protein [Cellulosimicrobium marinum]MCB7135220.1 hypothetical protein [Cellulosimicrobium marinum]